MSKFKIYYPSVYDEKDKAILDRHQRDMDLVNSRNSYNIADLISGEMDGEPGIIRRNMGIRIKAYEIEWAARNYDPGNPLYSDREYAKRAGYNDVIAFPTLAAKAEFWPTIPEELRDYLVVSGLNHTWYFYEPVYAGDTLYGIAEHQEREDITIPGTPYRTFAICGNGKVYNQNGKLVAEAYDRTKESLKNYADPNEKYLAKPYFWECPDWSARPRHYYTDEDWAFIKGIWEKETVRGNKPLYWEDVNISDEPAWSVDGPITAMDQIRYHGAAEAGGRSLRQEMDDPRTAAMLQRDKYDGIYYFSPGCPHLDEGRVNGSRAAFYNYMPANHAIKMLSNWHGAHGWLYRISWRIMSDMPGYEGLIPDFPDPGSYIARVPYLKGRKVDIHGLAGDLCLNKSYVVDKYINENGHFVDLVWWTETINGEIYEEGYATVRLPSKDGQK